MGYYSYGALGTDQYPPFTLGPAPDYPASLDIAYPQHLTRGLVLVKWLLALPHYVIIALFVGGGTYAAYSRGDGDGSWASGGLIGLLVLIAGIALLVTGRYPRGVFDLLLGMNRWVLRVSAYTALMTDEYPPFRLDMGGSEPPAFAVAAPSTAPATEPTGTRRGRTGRIVTVVVGSLLLLGGVGVAVGGSAVLAADRGGRDAAGFLDTPAQTFTGNGYALVFDPLELSNAATSDTSTHSSATSGSAPRLRASGCSSGSAPPTPWPATSPPSSASGWSTSAPTTAPCSSWPAARPPLHRHSRRSGSPPRPDPARSSSPGPSPRAAGPPW